jgi:hypothetical protein
MGQGVMSLGKLRIVYDNEYSIRAKHVYLNGVDIGKYIRSLSFTVGVDNAPPIINLEIIARPEFEQDTEVQVEISRYDPLGLFEKAKSKVEAK